MVTISPEGKITDVNEASVKITGVSRDQLIGSDFSVYFTNSDAAIAGYQQVFEQGSITDYPLTLRDRDATLTEVLCNASLYRDTGGEVLGVLDTARDMTQQMEAAQNARSLTAAEDLVRNVLASSSIGIALVDLDGSFWVVNRSMCDLLGYDEAWFLERRVSDIIHPDDLEEALRERALVLAGSLDSSHPPRLPRSKSAELAHCPILVVRDQGRSGESLGSGPERVVVAGIGLTGGHAR